MPNQDHNDPAGASTKPAVQQTLALMQENQGRWRDRPQDYWLARLMQEVGELGSSLVGDHEDPPEHELRQVASIAMNWLEMRLALSGQAPAGQGVQSALSLMLANQGRWRDKSQHYWLARLMQEVGELASSLVGDHEDPPEHELRQVASIAMNWLEMRLNATPETGAACS